MIFAAGAVSMMFTSLAMTTNNGVFIVLIIMAAGFSIVKCIWKINRTLLRYITYYEDFEYDKRYLSE